MDSKRHERGSEATLHDFALVTTYLPVVGLTLRAALLVGILYWCMYTIYMSFAGVLAVAASIVYLDGLMLQSHLDKATGHLCLVALAVLTQQHVRPCSESGTVFILVWDVLWSTCSSAEVVSSVSSFRNNVPHTAKIVAVCIFCCVHVLLACSHMTALEMLVRAALFYVLCCLVVLCAPFAPPADRCSCSAVHVCAPVLFVHVYPSLASVLLIVGAHARLVYSGMRVDAKRQAPALSVLPPSSENDTKQGQRSLKQTEYMELAAKLHAAKRAQGMA